jgi:sulfur-oxidizing protein SoxX
MARSVIAVAALVAAAGTAAYSETAPLAVTYESGAVAASLSGAPGNPEEGIKVMSTRSLGNCVACHQVSALPKVPFQGNVGPALDGTGSRWSEAQLRGIVANAKMTFEGTRMPAFYKTEGFIRPGDGYTADPAPADLPPILTAQQIEDVVAFLVTLKE